MKSQPPAEPSVIITGDGHALVFQGHYQQALFIPQPQIARCLDQPTQADLLVIPPFAALALECYSALSEIRRVEIADPPATQARFHLGFRTARGPNFGYSSVADRPGPAHWHEPEHWIDILVTPMAVFLRRSPGHPEATAVIASIPGPEQPDYAGRFATDPHHLRTLLEEAVLKYSHRPSP